MESSERRRADQLEEERRRLIIFRSIIASRRRNTARCSERLACPALIKGRLASVRRPLTELLPSKNPKKNSRLISPGFYRVSDDPLFSCPVWCCDAKDEDKNADFLTD